MFKYKYKIPKTEIQTTYGSVCVENIIFEPYEIEKILPDLVLEEDNLKHMFAETYLNEFKKRNIYKRFIPKEKAVIDLDTYVNNCIRANKTFYSFLAEGILGLVYRDIYGYDLAKGLIDIRDTLSDSHTGVDACMYNLQQNIIVLGEAKFYEDLKVGINAIINDFTKNSIKNKLESLQSAVENSTECYQIVIKNLAIEEYEEQTIDQFMNQKIIFAGFVLHSENDINNYSKPNFYDEYNISAQQLKDNICKSLSTKGLPCDYQIILVHLPIKDKKSLIVKMIEESRIKLKNM